MKTDTYIKIFIEISRVFKHENLETVIKDL